MHKSDCMVVYIAGSGGIKHTSEHCFLPAGKHKAMTSATQPLLQSSLGQLHSPHCWVRMETPCKLMRIVSTPNPELDPEHNPVVETLVVLPTLDPR